MRRAVIPFILLILGASLLMGPALADHAYSHRYIVVGRVIDSEGFPVEGVQVSMSFRGATPDHGCNLAPRPQPVTDSMGQFFLCDGIHGLSHLAEVTVSAEGQSVTEKVDADLRRSIVNLRLDEPRPEERGDVEAFTSSYTIRGVVWKKDDSASVEGISVNGVTQSDAPVSAVLTLPDGTTREANTTTDGYGDYEITFTDVPVDMTGATVAVTSKGVTETYSAESPYRLTGAPIELPEDPEDLTPLLVIGGVVAGAVALYGGYRGFSKYQEQRELERVRQQSGRKRANR